MEQINPEVQNPQQPQSQSSCPTPPPSNNLAWAILTTILCCMPFGIVAIVKAASVERLWYQGFHEEAQKAAKSAGTWSLVSCLSGVLFWVLYIVFVVVLGLAFGEDMMDLMEY